MLKRLATIAATFFLSAPALATPVPSNLDADHTYLWHSLQRNGVKIFLNDNRPCYRDGKKIHGVYVVHPSSRTPMLAICQENGTRTGYAAEWTYEDLDTLRHEAAHFLQDCLDGSIDSNLRQYYNGRGVGTYSDVLRELGPSEVARISKAYRDSNVSSETIRLELEAFFIANTVRADLIGREINRYCSPIVR